VVTPPPPLHLPRYSWGHGSLSPQNRTLSGIQNWSESIMCNRIGYKKHSSGHPRPRIISVTLCGRVHVGWMMVRDAMHQILCSALSAYFAIASLHNTKPTYLTHSLPTLHTVIPGTYHESPCSCSSVTTRAPSYCYRLRFQ
jgi:hypothetical protein